MILSRSEAILTQRGHLQVRQNPQNGFKLAFLRTLTPKNAPYLQICCCLLPICGHLGSQLLYQCCIQSVAHNNLLMQLNTVLVLIFLSVLWSVSAQSCPQAVSISNNNCQFLADNPNLSCSIFNFKSCKFQSCQQYETFRGQTYCKQYQNSQSTDWNLCTQRCCNPTITYPQTWDSIQSCQQYAIINSGSLGSTVVALSVSMGLVAAVVVVFVYCWCCSKRCLGARSKLKSRCEALSDCIDRLTCSCCLNMQNRPVRQRNRNGSQSSLGIIEAIQIQQTQMPKQWVLQTPPSQKLNDSCSICLNNQPSLLLECGHAYHRECVCESIKFKLQCSVCRCRKINNITVHCQKCYRLCFKTTLLDHRLELSESPQVCPTCTQGQQIKGLGSDGLIAV